MLDALVKLAQDKEFKRNLPPAGFYNYSQPIRWTVQIGPTSARLEESNLEGLLWARPYTGRVGNAAAHPLADEAAFVFGIEKLDDKGGKAKNVDKFHQSFVDLLDKMVVSAEVGEELKSAIGRIKQAISEKWLEADPRFSEVLAKDWVAFEVTDGPLAGERLFRLPEAQKFWLAEIKSRVVKIENDAPVIAECAICGELRPMVGRIPINLKPIGKTGPIHSINASAFASGRSDFKGHIGLCYECSDAASQSFNALAGSKEHRRILVKDQDRKKWKVDSLRNQVALFWLEKGEHPLPEADFDFESALGDLMRPVSLPDDDDLDDEKPKAKGKKKEKAATDPPKPQARLSQLSRLLNVQWQAKKHYTNMDGSKFALTIFSPNVGRTALREWLYQDLNAVIPHVRNYLNATTINDSRGKRGEPQHINALMEALESKNVNLTRDLIRTAYQGTPPPREMLALAVQRFRTLTVKGKQDKQLDEWQRQRQLHALAAALKLGLFFEQIKQEGKEDFMEGLEREHLQNDPAYLCGRLMAVLEEAQQIYTRVQHGKPLKTSMAQRSFGGASISPAGIFPKLVQLATVAHLPKAGKFLNTEMELLVGQLVAQGGYPRSLNVEGQGRFGLGYWHQRGAIRANWTPEEHATDQKAEEQSETEGALA